jgi:choline kinase
MRAIILAAGRNRLLERNETEKPLCLNDFQGRPLLDWQLKAISEAGIDDVAVVKGYAADQIKLPVKDFANHKWDKSDIVRSLMQADDWLSRFECVVAFSNIFYTQHTVDLLAQAKGDLVIAVLENWKSLWETRFPDVLPNTGKLIFDEDGNLCEIGGNASSLADVAGQFMGLMKITPSGWQYIKRYLSMCDDVVIDKMSMIKLLQELIKTDHAIKGVRSDDEWFVFDRLRDLKIANQMSNARDEIS